MCVKTEFWALPLSDALLLPVSMATAARRLRNGIFNHLLCLQMYLITDHTRSAASSHMGTEAAASRVPPSAPGLWHNWPCPEIWAFGAREMGKERGHLPNYGSSLFCCCGSKWELFRGVHGQCPTAVPAQWGGQQGAPRVAAGHAGADSPGKSLWSSCTQLLCFQVQCLLSFWICKIHGFGKMP